MTRFPRRALLTGAAATMTLAACGNGVGSSGAATIDSRVNSSLSFLENQYPGTRDLRDAALELVRNGETTLEEINRVTFVA